MSSGYRTAPGRRDKIQCSSHFAESFQQRILHNVASLQQLIIGCTILCGTRQDLSQRAALRHHNTYMISCAQSQIHQPLLRRPQKVRLHVIQIRPSISVMINQGKHADVVDKISISRCAVGFSDHLPLPGRLWAIQQPFSRHSSTTAMSSIQAMCMSRNHVAAVELPAAGSCRASKVNFHLPLPGRLRCPLQPYFQAPAAIVALSGSVQRCCQTHGGSQILLQHWLWRTLGEDSSLPCLELHTNTHSSHSMMRSFRIGSCIRGKDGTECYIDISLPWSQISEAPCMLMLPNAVGRCLLRPFLMRCGRPQFSVSAGSKEKCKKIGESCWSDPEDSSLQDRPRLADSIIKQRCWGPMCYASTF